MARRILISSAILIATAAHLAAQGVNFNNPTPGFTGFGRAAVVVSDVDGGGRRDVVVSTVDFTNSLGNIDLMSSETGATLATFGLGPDFGMAVANIGDFDRAGNDDIAVLWPTSGSLWLFSGTVVGSGGSLSLLTAFTVPSTSGGDLLALADLNGDGVGELALGDPSGNVVHILDISAQTVLYSISDVRLGSFGAGLASAGDRLAVGAPTFSSSLPPGPARGYVNIHKLSATGAVLQRTVVGALAPSGTPREFGRAIAPVGDVDGDLLTDFAVLAPSVNSPDAFVAVVSEASAVPLIAFSYGAPTTAGQGRIVSASDVNNDGRSDVVLTSNAGLHLIDLGAATPAQVASRVGTFDGVLASGPSLGALPFGEVIAGRNVNTTGATVSVIEIAAERSLPNPPSVVMTHLGPRFLLGTSHAMDVSTVSTTPVLAFLALDFDPTVNLPTPGGTAFINPASPTMQLLGFQGIVAGTPGTFGGLNVPNSAAFLNLGIVLQAATIDSVGNTLLSNGLIARLGSM